MEITRDGLDCHGVRSAMPFGCLYQTHYYGLVPDPVEYQSINKVRPLGVCLSPILPHYQLAFAPARKNQG